VAGESLRDAHRQGVIAMDVTAGYKKPKGTRGSAPRVLTPVELKKLLSAPDRRSWQGKRDVAALVLMGVGGLRIGEVARMRMADVDLQSDRVVLKIRGKGNRVRLIALAGRNASPIRAWAKVRGAGEAGVPFFVARRSEDAEPRGMSIPALDYVVRRNAAAAGLAGVHAHCLRHTSASLMLANGANLVHVRDALGHSSIVTTSRYLHATGSAITTVAVV